jgi:hypothetical protein
MIEKSDGHALSSKSAPLRPPPSRRGRLESISTQQLGRPLLAHLHGYYRLNVPVTSLPYWRHCASVTWPFIHAK